MAPRTVSQVRKLVEAHLVGQGFARSRYAPPFIGKDAAEELHKSIAVGVPSSRFRTFEDREDEVPEEGEAITAIEVWTYHQLRAESHIDDYDAGLDHEHRVIQAVLGLETLHIKIVPEAVPSRDVSDDGHWLIATFTCRVYHRFELLAEEG